MLCKTTHTSQTAAVCAKHRRCSGVGWRVKQHATETFVCELNMANPSDMQLNNNSEDQHHTCKHAVSFHVGIVRLLNHHTFASYSIKKQLSFWSSLIKGIGSILPSGNCFVKPNRVKSGLFQLSKTHQCFIYYCFNRLFPNSLFNNLKWVGSRNLQFSWMEGTQDVDLHAVAVSLFILCS